jgi:hypothetical protein
VKGILRNPAKRLNESGQLTLDFLFAAVLILGVSTLLGALTIVLTLTEILQYVSFSGARSYMAGNLTEELQQNAAKTKADFLVKKLPFLSGAQANDWLKIQRREAGNYEGYRQALDVNERRSQFVGYQIEFSLPLLGLKLPLLGPALDAEQGGIRARVSSFLMREPSTEECLNFQRKVYQALIRRSPDFQRATSSPGVRVSPDGFLPIVDNGC